MGLICEVSPDTGAEIHSFTTPGKAPSPGLAFNGVEVFYTDAVLTVIKVYRPDGTFLRDLPHPGDQPIDGLGASEDALFALVWGRVFVLSPVDGAVQGTLDVELGRSALTYAGARGTLFVRIGDERQVAEVSLTGTVLNTISIPENVTGLAFSSASGVLFAIAGGHLWGLDPDSGAVLPAYPIQLVDASGRWVEKSGALAADEVDPAGERCGNCLDDDGDGLVDFEDPACCPVPADLRLLGGRLQTAKGTTSDWKVRFQMASFGPPGADPIAQDVVLQMRSAAGGLFCATLDPAGWRKRRRTSYVFRGRSGRAHGIAKATIRVRANGELRVAASSPRMTLPGWAPPDAQLTMRIAGRCATTGVQLRPKGKGFAYP